eukprot:311613-Rhodomonas_salina.2
MDVGMREQALRSQVSLLLHLMIAHHTPETFTVQDRPSLHKFTPLTCTASLNAALEPPLALLLVITFVQWQVRWSYIAGPDGSFSGVEQLVDADRAVAPVSLFMTNAWNSPAEQAAGLVLGFE